MRPDNHPLPVNPIACELPNVFPNFPLFHKLIGFCHRLPPTQHAVRDLKKGTSATHIQLLSDVISVRNMLWASLDTEKQAMLERQDEVFISLLTPPGYEYIVGFLAILALGAVVVPLSPHVPLMEALYFVENSTSSGMLIAEAFTALAATVQTHLQSKPNTKLVTVTIDSQLSKRPLTADQLFISAKHSLNPKGAGLAIFTSGTTGRPKAVILPREIICSGAQTIADHYCLSPNDTLLHCMPVHHVAGITVNLVPFLISGAILEFHPFDVEMVWDLWRTRKITIFSGVPTMFMRLMRYWEENLRQSSASHQYLEAVRNFRFMMSGTSALPKPLRMKWLGLMDEKPILERYGSTELGSVILTPLVDPTSVPSGSVGTAIPGADIKLSESGEILVKAPGMILRYHNNKEATRSAFDPSGYFLTGDIGHQEGKYFFILGRASVDIIKSGGYKISALDVEREILGLDYIAEVAVIGVSDDEFGQRVAAIVVLRDTNSSLTLERLRKDMRQVLSNYKLPTLLYITKQLEKTASGKVQKKSLRTEIFGTKKYAKDIQVFQPARKMTVQARI